MRAMPTDPPSPSSPCPAALARLRGGLSLAPLQRSGRGRVRAALRGLAGAAGVLAASQAFAQSPPEAAPDAIPERYSLSWPWGPLPDRFVPDAGGRAAGLVEGSPWSLHLSPGTWHSNPSDDHRHSTGLGLRRALDGRQFIGFNAFSNSFGQPSAYAMYGQRLHGGVPALPRFYTEWTAGLMYGYVGDRADEVPLNVRGFSPVFTLSPGWQFTPNLSVQLNVIGTVAVMLQVDWRFR